MGKTIDLLGMKFGRWTVIEYNGKNKWGHSLWICQCECGNIKSVDGKSLRRKESLSCDCLRKEVISKKQFKDLTGKKIGRLKVIKYIGKNIKTGISDWLCLCDCKNEKIISIAYLLKKSGNLIKSCGCVNKETRPYNFIDLVGKKFGKLIVIKHNGLNKHGQTLWTCRCDCGSEDFIIEGGSLKNGETKSCGCLRESYIASELKKYCIKQYNADKRENGTFINPETKHPLPFDIYIPLRKIFIEVHGIQHYKLSYFHKLASKRNGTTPEEEFEYQKKKDRMKRKFARQNGTYIEIDLRKIKTIEQAISFLEKKLSF